MYKLRKFFNQNRKAIFFIILIIAFIILILTTFNGIVKKSNQDDLEYKAKQIEKINNKSNADEIIGTKNEISNNNSNEQNNIIKNFVELCLNNNVQEAYNLLTDECKDKMYPTLDDFVKNYYNEFFSGDSKNYKIEPWINSTYQVTILNDILAQGKIDIDSSVQDYITISRKDNEEKLNINSYIGRNEKNKVFEDKNIKILIKSIDTYMDYEIYNFEVENNSDNSILLDTSDDTKSIYIVDNNDMKYYSASSEINQNRLLVQSKYKNSLSIKFTRTYSKSRYIDSLVFSKVVLNYNEYSQFEENKDNYNYYKFVVNV